MTSASETAPDEAAGQGDRPVYARRLRELTNDDVGQVGGKNASLGEMIQSLQDEGVRVPGGFATTSAAYWHFLDHNDLRERIEEELRKLREEEASLRETGKAVRRLLRNGEIPEDLREAVTGQYAALGEEVGDDEPAVAVRSSATAEDLPEASFAGQQETFLNVAGGEELLEACRKCYASLFTDRAISYREEQGFDHMEIALSVGVQKMVRADRAGSGVMFSIDTETGFPDVVVINAAWGLGETVVQGTVNPDEYRVFKPLLEREGCTPILERSLGTKEQKMVYAGGGSETTRTVETSRRERRRRVLEEEEILQLARWAAAIEAHYGKPMDMEWAKDGEDGKLYILQARPETVQSQKEAGTLKHYRLEERGEALVEGLAIGQAVAAAEACVIESAEEMDRFRDDAILVTGMTDPDWVPIMKRARGIVTDYGGRTSHAAIVSRELGIPAVVGSEEATDRIEDGRAITLSCAEGETGYVYDGELAYEEKEIDLSEIPETRTEVMMNIASPAASFRWWRLPVDGIGLARMEFIINNAIKIHPRALTEFDRVEDKEARETIERLTRGYEEKGEYFVQTLAEGIARIAAPQHPKPVIVRMSDFKTNEYADLIGGAAFEPEEANPMLGWRGASRYYDEAYREGFGLECRAIRRVRETIGLENVVVMIPFCRTPEEADRVLEVMAEAGLERGRNGLEVYVMAEIPSNVVLAEDFAARFDGFSIGTNDLTQLVLGVDRDSARLSALFDEQNPAVKRTVRRLIETAHEHETKVGICGQAPSDHPDFAAFLVACGIDSMSLNPDSVIGVKQRLVEEESATA
jgi:pyruvate,water dikinase